MGRDDEVTELIADLGEGSAEEAGEEERTDQEAGHPPAQVLPQEPSHQTGRDGGEGQQTC